MGILSYMLLCCSYASVCLTITLSRCTHGGTLAAWHCQFTLPPHTIAAEAPHAQEEALDAQGHCHHQQQLLRQRGSSTRGHVQAGGQGGGRLWHGLYTLQARQSSTAVMKSTDSSDVVQEQGYQSICLCLF